VTGEALVGDEFFPSLPQPGGAAAVVVPSSPLAAMSGADRVYAIAIAAASKEIWIANSYFLPDDAASALLVNAVRRGVDVRVLVPSDEHNDVPATKAAGRAAFGTLLAGGVRIFEYAPTMYHLKAMVVDGVFSTVGSANFDARSFHLNEEVNLFVYDAAFARKMEDSFRRDLEHSRPYTLEMWRSRPLPKRVGEWLTAPLRGEL
jgi:cardiolipin synthase